MDAKEEQIHHGHRERLRHRVYEGGFDALDERAVLEVLLFYALPYKDVHPLSYRLMERFGGLVNVLNASKEELSGVDGMGENAVSFLRLLPNFCRIYLQKLCEPVKRYDNISKIGTMLLNRYIGVKQEQVYFCLFDNSLQLLSIELVYEGSINSARVSIRELVETAVDRKASMALVAHNHPDGIAIPSRDDMNTTVKLKQAFEMVGIPLLEHMLIGGESYTPLLYLEEGRARLTSNTSLITTKLDLTEFYHLKNEEAEIADSFLTREEKAVKATWNERDDAEFYRFVENHSAMSETTEEDL